LREIYNFDKFAGLPGAGVEDGMAPALRTKRKAPEGAFKSTTNAFASVLEGLGLHIAPVDLAPWLNQLECMSKPMVSSVEVKLQFVPARALSRHWLVQIRLNWPGRVAFAAPGRFAP